MNLYPGAHEVQLVVELQEAHPAWQSAHFFPTVAFEAMNVAAGQVVLH